MGWDYAREWQSARDVKDSLLRDYENETTTVIASGGTGNEFYLALERRETKERFVMCCLIEMYAGEWGVKTIHEAMHPFYYGCPDKVLKAAGPPNPAQERAVEWRAEVARQKARAKRKFNTGDRVIVNGRPHTIVNPTWTKTFATVRDEQGGLWKTRIKNIEVA